MVALDFADGLLSYYGDFPFFGEVTSDKALEADSFIWFFSANTHGTARFAEGLVSIRFFVKVPWVLAEPNPYSTS